jgi:hypothetical protein
MKSSRKVCAVPGCNLQLGKANRSGYCHKHREHAPHRRKRKPYAYRKSKSKPAKLVELEQRIRKGLEAEKVILELLKEIHDKGLYRIDHYSTYEEFLEDFLGDTFELLSLIQ